jgi:outer membrane protein assembly complex protein YaeT
MNWSLRRLSAALTLVLAASSATAQNTNGLEGKTVFGIEYEPKEQPIAPEDLQATQLVRTGEPLNSNQVSTTIDRLWATGLYDNIQVDAEPNGSGVTVRFITVARRFIGHVGAEGKISNPPSRAVLISDSQLYLGQPFDEETLETARKALEQELSQNGLYEGTIGTTTIEDPITHQVTVRFLVYAGKRARYEKPVITGNPQPLSDEAIIKATGWRWPLIHLWLQVTSAENDKGTYNISRKYSKKNHLTATVTLTSLKYDAATNHAQPTIDIEAGPRILLKSLEAKVSQKKLKQFVPIYEEGSVNNDLLTEGAQNLHDYFQSRGYPDVDVTFHEDPEKNGLEQINYYIATGPRRKLVNVSILGNTYFTPDAIHERMFLKTASLLMRYGRYSESFRHQDESAIQALYDANGFHDCKVTSTVETNYKGKPQNLGVTFRINEGKQWIVDTVKFEGDERLSLEPIRNQLFSVEGQPYAAVNIASDRNRILEYYYAHGFELATFSYTASPGSKPATMDLVYRVNEGRQEFIRQPVISGIYRTRPSLVEKFITLKNGEPVSLTETNDVAQQLMNLGIFANVTTALQDPSGSSAYKYVLYDFDEAARYSFNAGLGLEVGQFGATTNVLSNAGGAKGLSPIVSFDVNRINFRGIGQTISLQVRYSTLEQRESINYIIPRFLGSFNRTATFSILYDTTQDVQTFSARREEAAAGISQRFNRASTFALRFTYRRVSTNNVQIPSLLIPQLLQPVRIGELSASYIQDHRDNPADAHRGFWNTIDAGIAGGFFGSQRSLGRVLARNATYTPIGHNMTLARQTQVGFILPYKIPAGVSEFDDVPLPERFFGGGSVSMRGFGDNQAGPRDIGTVTEEPPATQQELDKASGFPIGGNGLFFNNVELRFPLLGPNVGGVLFEDMGNIYRNFSDISLAYRQPSLQDFSYAVQAAGFGIRYKTPLGPVRVDLAYALNPTKFYGFNTNETIQQLLTCTPSQIGVSPLCTATPQTLSHLQFFFSIGQAF